jgi:hypothetical protein
VGLLREDFFSVCAIKKISGEKFANLALDRKLPLRELGSLCAASLCREIPETERSRAVFIATFIDY